MDEARAHHDAQPRRQSTGHARSARRRWGFRLAAVLLGLALFAAAELLLALLGVGRVSERDDPYVGFDDIRPLFVPNGAGDRMTIPPARQGFFAPDSFPIDKGETTFRIFCLGGSTVQGRPYSSDTSFTTWLRLALDAAQPERTWEVINCGGISYASYRLVPILEECLAYQPDLFIVCTGHNEFLEERTYGHLKQTPPALKTVHRWLARLRSYGLLHRAWKSLSSGSQPAADKPMLSVDADTLLDYRNGIDAYHRDDDFRAGVVAHYEHNVRRMIGLAREGGVPLLLVRPPSNLRDCPPFKSEHGSGLSEKDLQRWGDLIGRAKSHYRDDLPQSIRLFRQALKIDPDHAATHYALGRCYLLTGQPEQARQAFLAARELDICPLRMIALLEQALAAAADDGGVPLIDAFRLLSAECPAGILGDAILVDHVHPKFRGHQLIADALADAMAARGWVEPPADWNQRRTAAYERHFDSLESIYFSRGLRELRALRAWAAGRADVPPDRDRGSRRPAGT